MVASAVSFTALYAAATFLPSLPEGALSDRQVLALIEDTGSRSLVIVAGVLYPAAGLALLPFLAGLVALLRNEEQAQPGVPRGQSADVVWGAGLLYIAMLMVAGSLFGAYATGVAVGELAVPTDATLVRVLSDLGFGILLLPGLFAAAAMVLATSLAGRRSGTLPVWLTRSGFVIAPLLLLGAAWAPQFLVPLWCIAVAIEARPVRQGSMVSPAASAA
jgi:hypothetical protein